jgi:hypothetical protein
VARCRLSPRRVVCNVWWPKKRKGHRAGEEGAFERNRDRVSFDVLQKSKSWVWHRGSASTAKSGTGVHGCLGRCRSLRPKSGPRGATEGTSGKRDRGGKTTARFQLARGVIERLLRGRGVGSRSGVERKLASMEGALGRGSGRPSRGFRRSGLGFVDEQVASRREAAWSLRIDRGARDSVEQAARGRKTPRTRPVPSVSARSRVVKRGAAR